MGMLKVGLLLIALLVSSNVQADIADDLFYVDQVILQTVL